MLFCLKLESARTTEAAAHWHTSTEASASAEATTTITATVTTTAASHWHTAHRHSHATHHTHTGLTCAEEVQTIAGAEHDIAVDGIVLIICTGHLINGRGEVRLLTQDVIELQHECEGLALEETL